MVGSLARGLIPGRRHVSFDAGGAIPGSAPVGPFCLGACGAGQVLLVGDRGHVLGQRDRGKGLGLVLGRGSVLPVIGLFRGRLVFVLADGRLVLSLAAGRLVAVLPNREAKSQAHVPYSRTRRSPGDPLRYTYRSEPASARLRDRHADRHHRNITTCPGLSGDNGPDPRVSNDSCRGALTSSNESLRG